MRPRSVLAIGAHPLDVEIHAAASLARMAANGARVTLVVCTDGVPAGPEGRSPAATRRRETMRGAEVAGIKRVAFLGLPRGGLQSAEGLRRELLRCIRGERPELVVCPDPTTHWAERDEVAQLVDADHRAAGEAALSALHPRNASRAAHPELEREGLDPWLVSEVWLFGTDRPNHVVDTSATAALKRAMLACHESQGPVRLVEEAADWSEAGGCAAEEFRRLRLL